MTGAGLCRATALPTQLPSPGFLALYINHRLTELKAARVLRIPLIELVYSCVCSLIHSLSCPYNI